MWKAMDSESGAHCQLSASCGLNPLSPTVFRSSPRSARRSNNRSVTSRSACEATRPGTRVPTSPGVEMTRVPPTSPAPPDVVSVPLHPPSRAAAASARGAQRRAREREEGSRRFMASDGWEGNRDKLHPPSGRGQAMQVTSPEQGPGRYLWGRVRRRHAPDGRRAGGVLARPIPFASTGAPQAPEARMTTTIRTAPVTGSDSFVPRHVGANEAEIREMLATVGYATLDDLIDATIPAAIRLARPLAIHGGRSEHEALAALRTIARKNRVFRSFLGYGYSDTITPPVIQRNILENPGWYTAYTPYQAEIAQGRLEALLNFQ